MDQKEKRNAEIVKLHNSGLSTQQIADKVGLSKAGVYKVINSHLESIKPEPKVEPAAKEIKTALTDIGQRITNFGEYQKTGLNQYTHKGTGKVINVKFIPPTNNNERGYFVTV